MTTPVDKDKNASAAELLARAKADRAEQKRREKQTSDRR